jgi:hypothetical protein
MQLVHLPEFNTVQKSKFKFSSKNQGKLLAVRPYKIREKVTCTSKIQWHGINITIQKGRNRKKAKKDQTKARWKSFRESTKSCSFMSSI